MKQEVTLISRTGSFTIINTGKPCLVKSIIASATIVTGSVRDNIEINLIYKKQADVNRSSISLGIIRDEELISDNAVDLLSSIKNYIPWVSGGFYLSEKDLLILEVPTKNEDDHNFASNAGAYLTVIVNYELE